MEGDGSPQITPENIKSRADDLAKAITIRTNWYRTPNVLIPWGCDFMYQNATLVFSNTDLLLNYMNAHSADYGFTLRYGTLSEYFQAIFDTQTTWPVRSHTDFFPLAYKNGQGKYEVRGGVEWAYQSKSYLRNPSTGLERLL